MNEPTEPSGGKRSPESVKFPLRLILFAGTGCLLILLAAAGALIADSPGDGGTVSGDHWLWMLIPFLFFLVFVGLILSPGFRSQKKKGDHTGESALEKGGAKPTTPPPPTPSKTNTWRTILFLVFLVAIGSALVYLGIHCAPRIKKMGVATNNAAAPIHHSVQRRICDVTHVVSYANRDLSITHDTVKITLVEGCYADWYIIPQYFDQVTIQLSQNADDYVSVWCNGNPNPYPVVEYYQQGLLDGEMNGCYQHGGRNQPAQITDEFHFQGHGVITLTANSRRPYRPVREDGYPAL